MKTSKTASTSLEIALSAVCGPEDIITEIGPEGEAIRRQLGYLGPQNFGLPRASEKLLHGIGLLPRESLFLNHMPALYVKRLLGGTVWDDYFTFAFERNPYERILSVYDTRSLECSSMSLKDYIDSEDLDASDSKMPERSPFKPETMRGCTASKPIASFQSRLKTIKGHGWHNYAIDGEVATNRVFLYEHLDCSLREIEERLCLPKQLDLPRVNAGRRKQRPSHSQVFGPGERRVIHAIFDREFDLFGYERLPEV